MKDLKFTCGSMYLSYLHLHAQQLVQRKRIKESIIRKIRNREKKSSQDIRIKNKKKRRVWNCAPLVRVLAYSPWKVAGWKIAISVVDGCMSLSFWDVPVCVYSYACLYSLCISISLDSRGHRFPYHKITYKNAKFRMYSNSFLKF